MFFTQEDYIKIQQWLAKNSVKDTEFNEANIPFNGEETITIVQGNQNKKVFLKDLIAQVFNLGISDFVNITDKYDAPNISLEEAIRLIPSRARKEGQVITFLDREDHWHIYQFKGALNQWNVLDTWEDLFDWENLIIDSILPDEEDLTKSPADANGNSYLSLKDREYNPEDFSGLGRVILRKNIVEVEDPIYGKVKKNYLYQDMMNKSNTIYEIRYDFDLNGQEITIPEGCVLDFQGGSLSNGSIANYSGYVNASSVGLSKRTTNEIAINNANLLIGYINMGFKINLDGTFYFNNTDEKIIKKDICIKNGKIIAYPVPNVSIKPFYVGKGCNNAEFNNVEFDTNLAKDCTRLVTPVFHVKPDLENTPHVKNLIFNKCKLDGVCAWFHQLEDFDYNSNPCGVDFINIQNCTILNSQSGSFSFDNTPHKEVIIANNKVLNMLRSVFRISTENSYITPKRGSVYFYNNVVENKDIIIPNDKWGSQYFTPILAEQFEHTYIENNTFNNLIIDSPVEQVYAFYVGGRNVYIKHNTQYNVVNLGRQDLNEIFKNKSGVNKYVEDNVYTIDEEYIKKKYPDYSEYDFTNLVVQFMTVNALITEDNPIGDYVVRRNDIIIPCKLKFGTPHWYVSKDLYFTDNNIKCNIYEGIILTFESNQSGVNVFIENNKLLANKSSGAHLLWFGDSVDFNVYIRNNHIQGLRRLATDGLIGHCVEEYNTYDNCSYNSTVFANHFGKNARFENNTIINNNGYAFYNIASSESLTASFNFKEGRTSFNWITLYDGSNSNSINIKYSYYNSNNDFIEDSAILVFNKETNQLIIKRSSLSDSILELNGDYGQIPLSEVEHGTNPCYLVQDNGILRLAINFTTNPIFVKIEKNTDILDRYPNIKEAYSTRNLQQLLQIVPDSRFKLFNNKLNNYVNYINNAWRNNDGTRLDKVIYVSGKSHFAQLNTIYIITDDIDLEGSSQTIPSNSTLKFEGGKIINGTLKLQNTKIIPTGSVISDYIEASIEGTYATGQCLFDAELGKPKWWTGSKWVDATGADV